MMIRAGALLVAALLAAAMPAAARAQASCAPAITPGEVWNKARDGNALVGTVIKGDAPLTTTRDGACDVSPIEQVRRAVRAELEAGGIVLLGEVHDNGAQHALRAELLRAVVGDLAANKKPLPALVFEHLRTDQAAALDASRERTVAGARDLMERLDWKNSGWPSTELFLPIFEVAVTQGVPILPGHPTRAEVRDVARRGLTALPGETVARLALDKPLPEALDSALLDELEASHCGLMPRSAFTNMALAQRYRDTHLAAALIDAAAKHGSAILFAGNGHVRADRGVPWDLARMAPERKVLTIMLLEVRNGTTDVAAHVERDPAGKPIAGFSILTPRTERPDPCEAMRANFRKK